MVDTPSQLGPYRLERLLGSGGFANVYLAFDTRRGHHVALKVLHPHYALGVTLERFQREGEQILLLRHQHIVGAYAVEQVDGRYVIAMQYMPGGSLADLLRQRGRLNLPEAARIVNEVAAALDYVHPKVVHRDLKPSNVLFDAQGRACVADFGIARISDRSSLTATGQSMGTPHYMAPEQVRSRMAPISPATDVWALGVMLYEMLCGQAPFIGEDSMAVLYQVVHETPPQPTELISRLPPAVDRILTRALAKDPRKRYQRAGDLARDVRSLVRPTPKPRVVKRRRAEQPTLHAPADHLGQPTFRAATPVPEHRRGGPALWIGLGIVGVVVVALLVSTVLEPRRTPTDMLTPEAITLVDTATLPPLPEPAPPKPEVVTPIPGTVPTDTPTPTPTAPTDTPTPTPWPTGDLWWTRDVHVYAVAPPPAPIAGAQVEAIAISADGCFTDNDGTCSVTVHAHDAGSVQVSVSAEGYHAFSDHYPGLPQSASLRIGLPPLSTSTDTPTPPPTATHTATPVVPTDTPTPKSYPAPTLQQPANGHHAGGDAVLLVWNWEGELGADEHFNVRIWADESTTVPVAVAWSDERGFGLDLSGLPPRFYWSVRVIRGHYEGDTPVFDGELSPDSDRWLIEQAGPPPITPSPTPERPE